MAQEEGRLLTLGRVTGLYGVRGWLKVFSYTDPRDEIVRFDRWQLSHRGQLQIVELEDGRSHGKGVIAKLSGVDDREEARAYIGAEIVLPRERLPETEPDEYYWADLEGLRVVTREGVELGRVDHLIETGANDVLVVKGERERLVPFVQGQYVLRIDLDADLIEVDWDPDF